MSELRRHCATLLNSVPSAAELQTVEAVLNTALTRQRVASTPLGETWQASCPEPEDTAARRKFLAALAPNLLLDGVWLARVAAPATAHRASESHLLALYCQLVGLDNPATAPAARFRAQLTLAGVTLPKLDAPDFFDDPAWPDFALELPHIHLCLLHRPRRFFPELLGYTLAHVCRAPAWWDTPATGTDAGNLAQDALTAYPQREAEAGRIQAGWNLYLEIFTTLARNLGAAMNQQETATAAMARIIAAKRAEAIGYHRRVMLQGRSLDEWLAEDDSGALLQALRKSPCPMAGRLLRATAFGGPMFGVFTEEEQRICAAWLAETDAPTPPKTSAVREDPTKPIDSTTPQPLDRRRLFTALLRAESPGDRPPAAKDFIERLLRRTRCFAPLQRGLRRPFAYTPERFHQRISAMHQHEVGRYRPLSGPPPVSRDYCRWLAYQLAPAILVDGAWLAGIPDAAEILGPEARHLLHIYADEFGKGRSDWNHPNVYRQLLSELDFEPPAIDSDEFSQQPLFLDSAFDIPVYLLAIGQYSDQYFPELLGLNLAIELSGLGAGYMCGIDILRHYRLDPTILQLHLSIDNLASGHAARARDAIDIYLSAIKQRQGETAMQTQWRRIWIGYLSLHQAASGLALNAFAKYLRERLLN